MHMLDFILLAAVIAIFYGGVVVGGIYGGVKGMTTELKRWIKGKVE